MGKGSLFRLDGGVRRLVGSVVVSKGEGRRRARQPSLFLFFPVCVYLFFLHRPRVRAVRPAPLRSAPLAAPAGLEEAGEEGETLDASEPMSSSPRLHFSNMQPGRRRAVSHSRR